MDSDEEVYSSSDSYLYNDPEYGLQLRDIIVADDKNAYVSRMNRKVVKQPIVPPNYWSWIFLHGSVDIANALLEGETCQTVDYDAPVEYDLPLMHSLTLFFNPALTELFIRHGAPTDRRCFGCVEECSNYEGMLPLNVALERIRTNVAPKNWNPKKNSLLDIITNLCIPDQKPIVETVRVLVLHTKEVEQEIYQYALEGKVIELAALLMAAREKVMSTIMYRDRDGSISYGGMAIYHRIWNEFMTLTYEEFKHVSSNRRDKLAKMCKDKKVAMMSTFMLLELFEKAGDAIELYFKQKRTDAKLIPMITEEQIAQDVNWLVQKADCMLKFPGSNLGKNCLRPKLHSETLQPSTYAIDASNLANDWRCHRKQGTMHITHWSSKPLRLTRTIFPNGYPVSYSLTRSIHTLPASVNSQTTTTVEAQVKNTIKSVDLPLPSFLLSRRWSLFAFAIKRRIMAV